MEEDLRTWSDLSAEDVFDLLFDRAPVLAHSLDVEGRIVQISRPWAGLLGYDPTEIQGRPLTDFLAPASAREVGERSLPKFLATGRVEGVALEAVSRDGEILPIRLSATMVRDKSGRILRSLAFITDLRATEAAMAALSRKAAEAEEASQAKSRFLAAMSHEIRTPMNAILGFAQLLELEPDLPEAAQGYVRAILSAGNGLMELLRDLLDLSQVEAGVLRVEPQSLDIAALAAEIFDFWRRPAAERGLSLALEIDPDLPPWVRSDASRIRQVLNNYLCNALKFTESGEVVLRVFCKGAEGERCVVRFEVEDSGPGISVEDRARLFSPFVQLAPGATTRPEGWGLGLSICAKVAAAMGARVDVESTPGAGATFGFSLPVLVTGPPDVAAEEPLVALPPMRLLLAEDNTLNQDVLFRLLHELGQEVVTVSNGFEAVEAARGTRFDAIVMDMMMPGLDGAAAIERIRAEAPEGARVPIIACTAHVTAEARERYAALALDAVLPKPVRRDALRRALAQVAGA